jgi:hypothetical protein
MKHLLVKDEPPASLKLNLSAGGVRVTLDPFTEFPVVIAVAYGGEERKITK